MLVPVSAIGKGHWHRSAEHFVIVPYGVDGYHTLACHSLLSPKCLLYVDSASWAPIHSSQERPSSPLLARVSCNLRIMQVGELQKEVFPHNTTNFRIALPTAVLPGVLIEMNTLGAASDLLYVNLNFNSFCVYRCFACKYVCALVACLVHTWA